MKLLFLHNKIGLIFSLIAIVFGLIIKSQLNDTSVFGLLTFVLLSALMLILSSSIQIKDGFILKILFISMFVKILAVFIMEYILINYNGMPYLSFKDDYVYNSTSTDILDAWKNRGLGFYDDIRFSSGFYSGYPVFSAFSKYLFGDHYLIPRFMNVFFSTWTIYYFYKTLQYITSEYISRAATLLLAFSSVFIVYSSLQLKDIILVFFLSLLIYGTFSFLQKGFKIRYIYISILSIVFLLFFRAAILLPYFLAILLTYFITKQKNNSLFKVKNILGLTVIIVGFVYSWEFLHKFDVLNLNAGEYFNARLSIRGNDEAYSGSNDLTNLGSLAILAGPILVFFSLLLPTPVFVKLDEFSRSINYHYLPVIEYYAILPMALVGLLFVIRNYRYQRVGVFLVVFLLLYKIGQAGGKSIFDSRQSLPAIYITYLLLGYFNLDNPQIVKLWKRYKPIIIILMVVIMFGFTYGRIIIRE